MQKRGLSDVVNTVMLIALTIVVISIVWIGVMPLIKDRIGSTDSCMNADVSVETSQGYTCWDNGTKKLIVVQVKVGNIDVNVSGFKFFVSSMGNSIYYPKESYALPNSFNVFYLNSTNIYSVDQIGVAAVVRNGRTTKDCPVISVDRMKTCDAGQVSSNLILNPSS